MQRDNSKPGSALVYANGRNECTQTDSIATKLKNLYAKLYTIDNRYEKECGTIYGASSCDKYLLERQRVLWHRECERKCSKWCEQSSNARISLDFSLAVSLPLLHSLLFWIWTIISDYMRVSSKVENPN